MVARTLTATQIAALRLPTVQEMHTLAAAIPSIERGTWRSWDTAPGSFLEVAPGMIRFTRSSAHLDDASRDRGLAARMRESKTQLAMERALYRSPMALLTDLDVDRVAADLAGGSVGGPLIEGKRITAWSSKSRSRMQQQLRRFDFTPLFADGLEPALVTLTMPGTGNDGDRDYWQKITPTPTAFKSLINRFVGAYRYSWGSAIQGVWKMEFQHRGAPHVHILMTPPAGVSRGRNGGLEFRVWLSREWARIVGATGEARLRHEKAGTGIDYVGDGYRDPQRIARYFGKHGAFTAKEYQNEMPAIWLDAIHDGAHGARFWGSWGLPKASAVLQLDDAGSASVEVLIDPLGVKRAWDGIKTHYRRNDDGTWTLVEERRLSQTDASWRRAYQRMADDGGTRSADDVQVQRYMRKLSRSLAHRGVQHVRNEHGQLVLPPARIRRVKYTKTDAQTGEIRTVRRYRVGYYHGGAGFVLVNDGRVTARDVQRILDNRSNWTKAA